MSDLGYAKYSVTEDIILADHMNGDAYGVSVFSETFADNGILNIFVKTNGHLNDRINVVGKAGGLCILKVTETATMETAGTDISLFNYNRICGKTSVATVTHGNSISNGTVIFNDMFGGTGPGQNASIGDGGLGFVLANSAHYNISMTNLSGGSVYMHLHIDIFDRS